MYQVKTKNAWGLKKGDYFYLDKKHHDHIEVFNKNGEATKVLNLDGTVNAKKTKAALKQKRTINVE